MILEKKNNISGPLFIGKDTHALSSAAEKTAIEVLAANNVETFIIDTGLSSNACNFSFYYLV